jgi:hypothetical protein
MLVNHHLSRFEIGRLGKIISEPPDPIQFLQILSGEFFNTHSSYHLSPLLTHLHADHFAADDDLHAPVLLPSGNGIVVGNRVSLAEPFGRDGVRR